MIQERLKLRIIRLNLLYLLPILLLCCAAAFSGFFGLMRRSQVRFLTSESYMSQVYLMERLGYGSPKAQGEPPPPSFAAPWRISPACGCSSTPAAGS